MSCFFEVNNWIKEKSKLRLRLPSTLELAVPRSNDTPDQSAPTKLSIPTPGVYDYGDVLLPYYVQIKLL